jgi:drug/metabolite transporter (DMT)-like permease
LLQDAAAMLVVLLSLGSAVTWGVADFLGGVKNRTLAIGTVAIASQLAAFATCLLVLPLTGEALPAARVVLYAALGGAANAVGLAAFYRGLAIGRMSVVAPIAGLSAIAPVVVGLASGDRPSALQGAGMAVAVVGVVLAARQDDGAVARRPEARRRAEAVSIALAVTAAAGLGGNLLGVQAAVTATDAFPLLWVLAVTRGASLVLLAVFAGVTGQARRPPADQLPALVLLGLLDLGANVLYAVATREALLSVAAVLASMHPVATVVLARALLGERIRGVQRIGVAFAVGGVALIAGA